MRCVCTRTATMATGENFLKWLNTKLRELKTDENVYGSYINGILDGDESIEEKKEAMEEILSQIIEDDIETILQTIIEKWEQCNPKVVEQPKVVEDVDTKLAKLMESNSIPTTVVRQQYTPEQLRIREQILAQYSQVELDECEDDDEPIGGGAGGGGGSATTATSDPIMMKNTNASDVAQLAKDRREQAKLDSKAKKDKDKEDREKQKQMREDKKEKRKTVKGERRR